MKYSQIVNIESNDNYKSEDLIHKKFIELICDRLIAYTLGSVGSFPCSIYKIYTVYLYTCVGHLGVEDLILSLSLTIYVLYLFCWLICLCMISIIDHFHIVIQQNLQLFKKKKNGNLFANPKIIFLYSQLAKQLDTLSNCLSTCLSHR